MRLSCFNLRVVHKCNAGVRLEDDLVANDTIILQGDTCCWICQKCKDYEFVFDKHNCKDCGEGFWPYENKTGCSKLPAKVNTFRVSQSSIDYILTRLRLLYCIFQYIHWNTVFAIVPICIACLGIILTLTTIGKCIT